MAANGTTFTPVQQKMLAVLADGMAHRREELHACLVDDLGPVSNIQVHISNMRKILRPLGQDIICEMGQSYVRGYRHVRLLASAVDGNR